MKWISKDPPIYVWPGDTWLNEKENRLYKINFHLTAWIHQTAEGNIYSIPFPNKTRILKE